jgi:hypothetical protein
VKAVLAGGPGDGREVDVSDPPPPFYRHDFGYGIVERYYRDVRSEQLRYLWAAHG